MMTVLIQDSPGLEVQAHDGSWIPVPVLPDTVVINIGLPLEEMTHGALAATVHRVNSSSVRGSAGRISVPFFLLPSLDIPLESVPIENVPEDLRRFIGQADELKTDVQKGWNGSITNRADRWIENRLRQNPVRSRLRGYWEMELIVGLSGWRLWRLVGWTRALAAALGTIQVRSLKRNEHASS